MSWIYIDERNRVLGSNPNTMEGNTGWVGVLESVNEETGEIEPHVPDELFNSEGVPLYKYEEGEILPRTQEEIEDDMPKSLMPEPTIDERLEAMESAVLYMLLGGE